MRNSHFKTVFLVIIALCFMFGFSACKKDIVDDTESNNDSALLYDKQPAVCYQGKTYYVTGKPVDSLKEGYEEVGKAIGISSSEIPYNDFEANDMELDGNTMYYNEEKNLIAIEWNGKYIEYRNPKAY